MFRGHNMFWVIFTSTGVNHWHEVNITDIKGNVKLDLKLKKDFIKNWDSNESTTKFESSSVAYLAAVQVD